MCNLINIHTIHSATYIHTYTHTYQYYIIPGTVKLLIIAGMYVEWKQVKKSKIIN